MGAGSPASLVVIWVIPSSAVGNHVLWEGVWQDPVGHPESGKPWDVTTFPGKWKRGFSNYRGAKLGRSEGKRTRGWGGLWTGGSRLKLDLETRDGAETNKYSELGGHLKNYRFKSRNSFEICIVFYNGFRRSFQHFTSKWARSDLCWTLTLVVMVTCY